MDEKKSISLIRPEWESWVPECEKSETKKNIFVGKSHGIYLGGVTDPKSSESPGTKCEHRFDREINFSELAVKVLWLGAVYIYI